MEQQDDNRISFFYKQLLQDPRILGEFNDYLVKTLLPDEKDIGPLPNIHPVLPQDLYNFDNKISP